MTKYEGIGKFTGVLANLAVVCLALTVSGVLLRGYIFTPKPAEPAGKISVDKSFGLASSAKGEEGAIVLALHVNCPYCTKSAQLYGLIATQARSTGRHVVAIFPDPPDVAKKYLTSLGVNIDDVRQADLRTTLGVRGTPTMIELRPSGDVKQVWYGLQPESENPKILAKMFRK